MENFHFSGFCKIILFFLALSLFSFSCKERNKKIIPDISSYNLEDGDIILRKGRSVNSRVVMMSKNNENYSHIGIVIKSDSSVFVVHSSPDDINDKDGNIIRKEEINDFLSEDKSVAMAIYRYELTLSQKKILLDKIQYYLDKRIKFDNDFDLIDTNYFYCTEFVWRCYKALDIDISAKKRTVFPGVNKKFIFPSDIAQNSNLKLIHKYPK